ncbi:4-oxalocrotonate tautomerase [Mycolicibacterium rhodesiae JS60]|nr:4-oxalocrotonate tautomerase [Mycolicibacterium rhodesiae JS60]
MTCWEIFAPENAYTEMEKEQLSESITSIYVDHARLPKFYVVVIFHEKPAYSMYVGGKAADNFVRIRIDHCSRQLETAEMRAACMAVIEERLAPLVKERGFNWEVHIDETPMDLWRVQGLVPPLPESEMERAWVRENRPIPYEVAQ